MDWLLMNEKKLLDLIHKDLDGLATEKEVQQLNSYLNRSQKARKIYEELKNVEKLLSHIQKVDPPSELKLHIMNLIKARNISPVKSKPSLLFSLRSRFRFTVAYAMIAGVLIGTAFSYFILHKLSLPDYSKLTGTLLLNPNQFKTIDFVEIDKANLHGSVKLLQASSEAVLALQLINPRPVEVQIHYNPAYLHFASLKSDEGENFQLFVSIDQLQFKTQDNQYFYFVFNQKSEGVERFDLKFLQNSTVIFTCTLGSKNK